jgi:hypothetical protein
MGGLMTTAREIGEPVRRGSGELGAFAYQPNKTGAYTAASVAAYNDTTDEDVTAGVFASGSTASVSGTPKVIATSVIKAGGMLPEQVIRIHFRYSVDDVPYDEYRRVIVEK